MNLPDTTILGSVVLIANLVAAAPTRAQEAGAVTAATLKDRLRTDAGLCVVFGSPRPERVVELAKASRFMVYVHGLSASQAQAARAAAEAAGLLGRLLCLAGR